MSAAAFFLLLSASHNWLTCEHNSYITSYQCENIKIRDLGDPKFFISLAKFTTFILIRLLGSPPSLLFRNISSGGQEKNPRPRLHKLSSFTYKTKKQKQKPTP